MNIKKALQLLAISAFAANDIKSLIENLSRGKLPIDGSILLGINTDARALLLEQLKASPYGFYIYGDGKSPITCHASYTKLYSNHIYIRFNDSFQREINLCVGKWEKEYNLFEALGSLTEIPIYMKWLGFSALHFYLFGGFKNFDEKAFMSDMEVLPLYSTTILITQGSSIKAISGEVLLKNFAHYGQNPYIQYLKFIALNPTDNTLYVKTDFNISSFITDINTLVKLGRNEDIIEWQLKQITKYIEFVTQIKENSQINEFKEFVKQSNLEDLSALSLWLANNFNTSRYKELLFLNYINKNETTKLKTLLDNSINVELKSYNEATPLCISAQLANFKAVKLLLDYGAKVNALCTNGITPVMASVLGGSSEILEYLLLNKADVNLQDLNGNTALILSIGKSYNNLAKILIKFGANVNTVNKAGETALSVASSNLNVEGIQILLDAVNEKDRLTLINLENKQRLSPLSKALLHEDNLSIELVELFLRNGARVKEEHVKQVVIERGRFDIADLLIEYADFALADNSNYYSPQGVCTYKNSIINFMLKYSSTPQKVTYNLEFVALHNLNKSQEIEKVKECLLSLDDTNSHNYDLLYLCSYDLMN